MPALILLALVSQYIGVHGGHGNGSTTPTVIGPSIVLLTPSSSPYETSAVTQVIAGTARAGTAAISSVTVVCTGATTLSYTATGTTSWSDIKTLNTGTTSCVATVTDASARTAARSFTFIVINPDAGAPTINAGADASTTSVSLPRSVSCTDDVGCTGVTWSGPGGSGTCSPSSTNAPTGSYNCTFLLATTGSCGATLVNTITVTATDLSGNIATDTADITRTAALSIVATEGSSIGSWATGVARTGSALTGSGGDSCSYTWGTNGAGSASSLNTSDSACAGVALSTSGVPSGTATYAGGDRPKTCNWTASLGDGTTTVTKPLTMIVTNPSETTYFQQIAALTEAQLITSCAPYDSKGCSLQNADEIHALAQAPTQPDEYSYDATENAAKITWNQADANAGSTMRVPIHQATGTHLLIWDFKPGLSWGVNGTLGGASCGGVVDPSTLVGYDHKEFQVAMETGGAAANGEGSITDEVKTSFTLNNAPYAVTCADVGVFSTRWYPTAPNANTAAGLINVNPVKTANGTAGTSTQAAQTYLLKHSVWTRYWMEVRLNQPESAFTDWTSTYGVTIPTGTYHMISLWVADENRAPVRLLYKAPMQRGLTGQSSTITSLTHVGTTATVTASSTFIGKFDVGDTIYIAGASPSVYNSATSGDFTITRKTTTTVEFLLPSSPASDATGTITMTKVRDALAKFWYEHNTSDNPVAATGPVTFTATTAPDGTVIPLGTVLTRVCSGCSHNPWQYKTDAAVTIAGGTATVNVSASPRDTYGGPEGNISAGTSLTVSATVSGVTAAAGSGGIVGGHYVLTGDLVAHARWFLWLKNYTFSDPATPENDTTIFQKPR